tara:strand:- start:987 stop:1448 length:462 start_codon:yes stop_codon:yes gene_type:complete
MVLFYLILGGALLFLIYLFLRWFYQADAHYVARVIKLFLLGGVLFVLIASLLTGRIAFFLIGAVALLPFYPRIYRFLKNSRNRSFSASSLSGPLSVEKAREILGVSETATREDIVKAHKKLIRKIHPDQGGSDYLALQVNQAKDLLLEILEDS